MAAPDNQYGLKMAQALRGWEEENPWKSAALGFVPVAGQVAGLASAAAAFRDPEASTLDKALATLSITPFGALVKGGKAAKASIIGGPKTIERLRNSGVDVPDEMIFTYDHPQMKKGAPYSDRIELDDPSIDYKSLMDDLERKRGGSGVMLRDYMFGDDKTKFLRRLFPELKDVYIHKQTGKGGTFFPGKQIITMNPERGWADNIRGRGILSHEIQHLVQNDVENLPQGLRGTSPDAVGWGRYIADVGEMEARINALRHGGQMGIARPNRGRADQVYSHMVDYLNKLQGSPNGLRGYDPMEETWHVRDKLVQDNP